MTIKITVEKPLPDSDYYKSITPSKPHIYRKVSGYCCPEMYVDPDGLRIAEQDGSLWVRNVNMKQSNEMNSDVIAVIPKSQVLSLYTALQMCLKDKGFLNESNELPSEEPQGSGHEEEYSKRGLRL